MSATILTVIVLIVMWVVVLVPLLVRRAEDSEEAAALWAPAVAGAAFPTDRVTGEFTTDGPTDEARPARAEAEPDPATATWAAHGSGGERAWAAHGSGGEDAWADFDRPRAASARLRSAVLARRRRALAVLALLVAATAAAATLTSPLLWLANAVADVLLVSYLTRLRAGARNACRTREDAVRQDVRPAHRPATAAPAYRPTPDTRRPTQVIDLDDEDPSFAQLEVRYPRAANE